MSGIIDRGLIRPDQAYGELETLNENEVNRTSTQSVVDAALQIQTASSLSAHPESAQTEQADHLPNQSPAAESGCFTNCIQGIVRWIVLILTLGFWDVFPSTSIAENANGENAPQPLSSLENGQVSEEAQSLAGSALQNIAGALAQGGNMDEALEVANRIPNQTYKEPALQNIAGALAQSLEGSVQATFNPALTEASSEANIPDADSSIPESPIPEGSADCADELLEAQNSSNMIENTPSEPPAVRLAVRDAVAFFEGQLPPQNTQPSAQVEEPSEPSNSAQQQAAVPAPVQTTEEPVVPSAQVEEPSEPSVSAQQQNAVPAPVQTTEEPVVPSAQVEELSEPSNSAQQQNAVPALVQTAEEPVVPSAQVEELSEPSIPAGPSPASAAPTPVNVQPAAVVPLVEEGKAAVQVLQQVAGAPRVHRSNTSPVLPLISSPDSSPSATRSPRRRATQSDSRVQLVAAKTQEFVTDHAAMKLIYVLRGRNISSLQRDQIFVKKADPAAVEELVGRIKGNPSMVVSRDVPSNVIADAFLRIVQERPVPVCATKTFSSLSGNGGRKSVKLKQLEKTVKKMNAPDRNLFHECVCLIGDLTSNIAGRKVKVDGQSVSLSTVMNRENILKNGLGSALIPKTMNKDKSQKSRENVFKAIARVIESRSDLFKANEVALPQQIAPTANIVFQYLSQIEPGVLDDMSLMAMAYILENGSAAEGILRQSGSLRGLLPLLKEQRKEIESNPKKLKSISVETDIHLVANSLKETLGIRQLFQTIYEDVCQAAQKSSNEDFQREVGAACAQLSEQDRAMISNLFHFLSKLAENREVNKMTPANLASCIAPRLVGDVDMETTVALNQAVARMIERTAEIFP